MRLSTVQRGTSPFDGEFDDLVNQLLRDWHVPGISIAVVDGSETYAKGYGIAVYPDTKVTPETLFFTASTTKSFTAAAVSLLVDDCKTSPKESGTGRDQPLDWKTPLSSIIPEDFVLPDTYATAHITLEDALSHRTGLPDHKKHFGPNGTSVKEAVGLLRYLPLSAEIRTKFMYNSTMFTAISHMIETVTGKNLGQFLRERIWNPLGMSRTFWTLQEALSSDAVLAQGYAWDASTGQYIPESLPDYPAVSGAGAAISNVVDYAKWLRCMITQSAPLSPEGHTALIEPRTVYSNHRGLNPYRPPHLYALGWVLDSYRGERVIWHGGSWTGFGTTMAFLPARRWGIVITGNTTGTSNCMQTVLYMYLLDRLLGTPPMDRIDWDRTLKRRIADHRAAQANARERLYPSLPSVPIPPALQIADYAGEYCHPAYRAVKLTRSVCGQHLVADRTTQEIKMKITIIHVSGEFWLATLRVENQDPRDHEVVRAEFRLAPQGCTQELGIELEPEMNGEKIWFRRLLE